MSLQRRIDSGEETITAIPSKRPRSAASPSSVKDDWGRIGTDVLAPADLQHRVGEAGVAAGRNQLEHVAEVTPDRALGHVHPDDADFPLLDGAQRPDQRGGAGAAHGGDEDVERLRHRGANRSGERSLRGAVSRLEPISVTRGSRSAA